MVYEFIVSLDAEEAVRFMEGLEPKTRSRRLLQVLRSGITDKNEILKRVFKVKRSVNNDHLLRNELSILKRKVENFVANNTNHNTQIHILYRKEYIMAEWCIKKTLIEPATHYVNSAYKKALSLEVFEDLLKISRLRLHITQLSKSNYQHKLDEMKLLHQDHLTYLKEFASRELKYADFINAGAFKLASNLRMDTFPFEPIEVFTVHTNESKNMLARYYTFKSQAYSSSGPDSISLLESAIKILYTLADIDFANVEILTCYAAIAMEYSLMGNFSKSEELYEFIFTLPGSDTFASRKSLLYNYCTTLLKNGNYKRALKYIEYLENSNPEPVVAERIYTMKINCYILLEDAKKILKILPPDLQNYDITLRTYYRFLYVIYYLIKEEWGLAERELNNIRVMKDFKLTGYTPLLQLFEKYVQTSDSIFYREKNPKKKLESLRTYLKTFHDQNQELSGLLPAAWITRKINAL